MHGSATTQNAVRHNHSHWRVVAGSGAGDGRAGGQQTGSLLLTPIRVPAYARGLARGTRKRGFVCEKISWEYLLFFSPFIL